MTQFFVKKIKNWKEFKQHCIISLSFWSFLYNGVCFDVFKLSVSDVIVSQKDSNGDRSACVSGYAMPCHHNPTDSAVLNTGETGGINC